MIERADSVLVMMNMGIKKVQSDAYSRLFVMYVICSRLLLLACTLLQMDDPSSRALFVPLPDDE